MKIDQKAVSAATRALLVAMGADVDSEALQDTPGRVARAWAEMLSGYAMTAEDVLKTTFAASDYDQIVALRDISFYSTCEHHLIPFHGTADVAYLPAEGRVVGLSKLARLVEMHARRLQLQERLTRDVADDLQSHLHAAGVIVVVRAQHLCMCARGVSKNGASMLTSDVRGVFRDDPAARAEAFTLLQSR